jgi:hypothetical protein
MTTPTKLSCGGLKKPNNVKIEFIKIKNANKKKVIPISLSAIFSFFPSFSFYSFQNRIIKTAPANNSIMLSNPKASKATLLAINPAQIAIDASKKFQISPIHTRIKAFLLRFIFLLVIYSPKNLSSLHLERRNLEYIYMLIKFKFDFNK